MADISCAHEDPDSVSDEKGERNARELSIVPTHTQSPMNFDAVVRRPCAAPPPVARAAWRTEPEEPVLPSLRSGVLAPFHGETCANASERSTVRVRMPASIAAVLVF